MTEEILLTIITVTKNCVASIGRTLDSVRAVKRSGVEYVVVDGASSDGTTEAIRASGTLVDRLISEKDHGIYNAMNKGVANARGRYILFINGDDELLPGDFPIVLETLANSSAKIICTTTLVGTTSCPTETLVARPWHLPFYNSIPHPSTFVARDLLLRSPLREDLRIVSDYDFFLFAYLSGQAFLVLPKVTALHQRGGASGNVNLSQRELERVRKERLGWRYPICNGLMALYRLARRLSGGALHV
ncbi:glycosyltransferase [Propionivibrio dicarboxylicus]|uniref:Glycosyltransferase involved in cell wall bisynthesis n=1 Tax=Propionivibrio dicarboxylicus TaxID=83767 RepID=A0A1G8DZQ1_9RHOO|nr:glycosyltransferase [Propionivibrio dicarboxylicus]SDH63051.1 Glycosyltransferase involved in cell wall bisynthesis [Propionivibrio dicarboxylicus]